MKRLWKIWADVDTWLGRDGFLTRDRLTGQPIQRNKIAYPETFPDVTISLEYGRKAPLDQVRKDCVLAVVWKHHLAIVLVNEDVVLVKWMMERDLLKARGERANLGAVCLVTTLCPLSMAGSLELEFFSVLPLLEWKSSWPIFREMNQYQSQRFACSSRLTPYHWNHRKPGFSLPFGRR